MTAILKNYDNIHSGIVELLKQALDETHI